MLAMTMEHLLNGAAAVDENSDVNESGSGSGSSSSSSSSGSGSSAANGARRDADASFPNQPSAKFIKTEHGAVAVPSLNASTETEDAKTKDASAAPSVPKLPPISSLTHSNGLPPSLQAQKTPPSRQNSAQAATDENLCRYRNKLCLNQRALKRNGELHNLCEKHRSKANQNQRKLESKRRVQKRQTRQTAITAPRAYQLTPSGPSMIAEAAAMLPHARVPSGLPSLSQLQQQRQPAPRPSYPYYEGDYPPYSR